MPVEYAIWSVEISDDYLVIVNIIQTITHEHILSSPSQTNVGKVLVTTEIKQYVIKPKQRK